MWGLWRSIVYFVYFPINIDDLVDSVFSRVLHTLISCRSKDYGAVVTIVSFGFGVALSLTSTFVGHVLVIICLFFWSQENVLVLLFWFILTNYVCELSKKSFNSILMYQPVLLNFDTH